MPDWPVGLHPVLVPAAVTCVTGLCIRHRVEPAIRSPPERALASDDGREAGAGAIQSFLAGFAAATVDASAAVEKANNGHDQQCRKRARPAGPQGHPDPRAWKQPSHDLRHTQAQGHRAQHEGQRQGAHTPRKRRPQPCPSREARDRARGQKRTPLAHAKSPAKAQNLVAVDVTQGMVRKTVVHMRPPSQAINAKGQGRGDARNRHDTLGASLTAVP